MADTVGSLTRRLCRSASFTACLVLLRAAGAAAQPPLPQPVVTTAPSEPEFLPRYDFHLNAERLITSLPDTDQRFSWDTHFGGSLDLADFVVARAGVLLDYEAVLGSEYRPFDPNQGNYILEGYVMGRLGGDTEVGGLFHHESRHLSDRYKPKDLPVAWNELGARILHRITLGSATVDADLEGGYAVEHAYVDYTWIGSADVLVRKPLNDGVGVFAHGSGQFFAVDGTVPNRGTQTGGLVEAGVRLNGKAGAIELFVGLEKRVDADPLDRQSQHWGVAGFRLLSR
jgi:hypothetical protein